MSHRTILRQTRAWVRSTGLGAAVAVLSLTSPEVAEAQLERMRTAEETTVAVQLSRAFFSDSDLSWYTSTMRGRVLSPASGSAVFYVDWGFSLAGVESGSDWTLANPEVGMAFLGDDGEADGYLSLLLPLAREIGDDDVSVFTGTFTDFNWFERYSENLWSINGGYTPSVPLGDSETARFNVALTGSVVMPRDESDTELFSRYVFGISQDTETLRIRGDLEGLAVLSESGLSFGERTIHQFVFGIDGLEGGPGFFLRIPIDDALDNVDAVVGATLTF